MTTTADLMAANLFGVFGERDAARRAAVAAETYSEDVVFYDPDAVVHGRDAVVAKAGALLDGAPGFVFAAAGPVLESHDLGSLAWGFGPPGDTPVVTGVDIALLENGRIVTLHTILDKPVVPPGS